LCHKTRFEVRVSLSYMVVRILPYCACGVLAPCQLQNVPDRSIS